MGGRASTARLGLVALLCLGAVPPPAATVAVRTAPGGVAVVWRLPRPVREVEFLDRNIVRDRWTIRTPGLTLVDGIVRADRPFDRFELAIAPDGAEVDRVYMGLTRVGPGHLLYGPALALRGLETALSLAPTRGEAAVPAVDAADGYAYLGPAAAVARRRGATVIAASSVPPALLGLMRDGFVAAQAFYGARLGRGSFRRPVLVVTVDSPGPMPFRGDVTANGVIATRFHGPAGNAPSPAMVDQLRTFVWHEAFHLWNGQGIVLKDGTTAPWLHEGGADYAALVAAVSVGEIDESGARAALARRLAGCRSALADRPIEPGRLLGGGAVYDCGVVVQWIADLSLRRASGGRRDILDLWRTMLDAARAGDGYGVADFRALLPAGSGALDLLEGPATGRWRRVEARLAVLGVRLAGRDYGTFAAPALATRTR